MQIRLPVAMHRQPDDRSCGPTCLEAVYRYLGDPVDTHGLVDEIPQLDSGGTLAVHLGCHALRRGYQSEIYTYNLQMFDPTWFRPGVDLRGKLEAQLRHKGDDERMVVASRLYLEYLHLGGTVRYEPLTLGLVLGLLHRKSPILTGLSATYLYSASRERPEDDKPDDICGSPVGHFVLLCGADVDARTVEVADPWPRGPSESLVHELPFERVVAAVLLGVLTYDANLLTISPEAPARPA